MHKSAEAPYSFNSREGRKGIIMRIAYLAQAYPPMISGAALFAQWIAEAMAQRGYPVLVIAASDREHTYCTQNGNLTILRLHSLHNPMRIGQRFLINPRRLVMKALGDFHPEIIHTHDPLQLSLLGIEYAKRAGIPIILTVHQLPWFLASYLPTFLRAGTEGVLWMYARWLAHNKFTSVITPSQSIAHLVKRMTGLSTEMIPFGLDLQRFHPLLSSDEESSTRRKWNMPLHVPILLHVGRLDTDKRVDRVIHAVARPVHETDAHVLIVGDGTRKPALIKLCKSLGISDRVHFLGYVSIQDGLPEIYRIANLFVTASEIEIQSLAMLAAAASGLPIVAVRATSNHEIVHHGINGYLAESGDLNGLSHAISLLLRDPQKANSMGRSSLILVANQTLNHTSEAHERFYRRLIWQLRTQKE